MPQLIETHETFNFRDFGGYTSTSGEEVRSGVLFRSGSLDKIADVEARSLQDSLSIQSIIDLRHPDEFKDNPTRGSLVDLVPNRHPLSVIDASQPMADHTESLNITYGIGQSGPRYFSMLENGEPVWREVARVLLEPESYPILAHCTAGKDRTGITAALVLDLVGVAQNTIAEDYAMSSASVDQLYDYVVEAGRPPEGAPEDAKARMITKRQYMDDFLTLLYQSYGNAEGYVKNLGFNDSDVARIREFLLA
ncbi:MAG: tyrosine-protein phosphatase [SAR202 cluster bacterium]|nr:tyrosine-protein phosphatase [SAR202 cluster bacterium]